MTKAITSAAAAFLFTTATANAQTGWSGMWQIVNGRCGEGLKVAVEEEPGAVVVKTTGNARIPSWEGRVALSADGSGKTHYDSPDYGPLELSVSPGSGRRAVTLTQQRKGICQWRVE
jgi:hypothetical protein